MKFASGHPVDRVVVVLQVYPTQSVFTFGAKGVELTVTFTTPLLTDDIEVMSRPVTYLTFSVRACVVHCVRVRWCVCMCVVSVRSPIFFRSAQRITRRTASSFTTTTRPSGASTPSTSSSSGSASPVRPTLLLRSAWRASVRLGQCSSAHTSSFPPLLRFEDARSYAHRHLRPARPAARTHLH
jgi:hypothetical protein